MFVDKVDVKAHAGKGGDGLVSFRRERYIDKGGPDGGDGGDGGDVILVASHNQNTLAKFRYNRILKAENGRAGGKNKRTGRGGDDLIVDVPTGTVVYNRDKEQLFDLSADGQTAVIAKGGQGGYGNAHFTSSTRQTPRIAEKGEAGEAKDLILELKMIAQVGLIGLPNAGKSTLLGSISNAKPEVANYPFTTIRPNLGVVDLGKDASLLVADIPGLIEGASEGKGLGDEFLKHVERTKVLIHLIDIYNEDINKAYQVIQDELKAYSKKLADKPQIIALNKVEGLPEKEIEEKSRELKEFSKTRGKIYAISAASGDGVKKLLAAAAKAVNKQDKAEEPKDELPVLTITDEDKWDVEEEGGKFIISGKKIERFAKRTDFNNPHGVQRLLDIMKKTGILHELRRRGIQAGDKIVVSGHTITF